MTRRDWGWLIAVIIAAAIAAVAMWWSVSVSLACGDRGGDLYWGPLLRHTCIAADGSVLP